MVIRDSPSSPRVSVEVDLHHPPSVVRKEQHPLLPHALSLDWDRSLDDHHHLRRCPICRCADLYARKPVPHVTGFILVLLAAVVAMVLFGFGEALVASLVLVAVLVIDVVILLTTRRFLVCYRCGTQFRRLAVPRSHPRWDAAIAERHQSKSVRPLSDAQPPPATEASSG